jgi:hypothetical protein
MRKKQHAAQIVIPVFPPRFDQLKADDCFVSEPARATSLYHIVGAVAALAS